MLDLNLRPFLYFWTVSIRSVLAWLVFTLAPGYGESFSPVSLTTPNLQVLSFIGQSPLPSGRDVIFIRPFPNGAGNGLSYDVCVGNLQTGFIDNVGECMPAYGRSNRSAINKYREFVTFEGRSTDVLPNLKRAAGGRTQLAKLLVYENGNANIDGIILDSNSEGLRRVRLDSKLRKVDVASVTVKPEIYSFALDRSLYLRSRTAEDSYIGLNGNMLIVLPESRNRLQRPAGAPRLIPLGEAVRVILARRDRSRKTIAVVDSVQGRRVGNIIEVSKLLEGVPVDAMRLQLGSGDEDPSFVSIYSYPKSRAGDPAAHIPYTSTIMLKREELSEVVERNTEQGVDQLISELVGKIMNRFPLPLHKTNPVIDQTWHGQCEFILLEP